MTPDVPERPDAPFPDHFSERAAAYAEHRPTYPAALVDLLADAAAHRTLAWDAGCGSGQLSVLLARRFERVIATDASAAQIARARRHPGVEYRRARAEASGLPDGVVDVAVAAQAAHWFDLEAYYAEVRRVTRPDAVIALACYGTPVLDDEIEPVFQHFHSDVLGPHWAPERRHVEAGYRSLAFPFDELETPELEIRTDWTLDDLLGYVETWSAVRALERAEGRAPVDGFRRDLARGWGRDVATRPILWPLSLRIGDRRAGGQAG